MGNFASNADWFSSAPKPRRRRHTIKPWTKAVHTPCQPTGDIISILVSKAIDVCKRSVHHVLGPLAQPTATSLPESDEDVFDEFQIVYDDTYTPPRKKKEEKVIADAPWFVYTPSDFVTKQVTDRTMYKCLRDDDNDTESATTECTEWLSDLETSSENPASSISDEYEDIDDDELIEAMASRLLRMASSCDNETIYFVEDYICKCGGCPQYEVIEEDVSNLVTWRNPEELISIIRILQAFSTYNETIGYQVDMIATADECLQVWNGDEDQAFTSFVMLQDEVPYLCASIV